MDISKFFRTRYTFCKLNLLLYLFEGRTFPNHEYFKVPFGLGQLSLFNLLKAYSILDPELGYCQGLAFICGVLLLHVKQNFDLNICFKNVFYVKF